MTGPQIDGFTPAQRFFLAWGQIRCERSTPEAARRQVHGDQRARAVPGRRRGLEPARVRRRVWLHGGRGDGTGEPLPDLVTAAIARRHARLNRSRSCDETQGRDPGLLGRPRRPPTGMSPGFV
jgi:hypothetical protein